MTVPQNAKTIGLIFFKLLVTLLFLYWAWSRIETPEDLAANFQKSLRSPQWLTIGVTLGGLCVFAAAARFYILLRAQNVNISLLEMFRITLIGTLFDLISFGSAAGDAYKMISLMRRNPGKKIIITMVTIIDHLAGFVSAGAIFLFFAWGTGIARNAASPIVKQTLMAATLFQVGGLLFVALCGIVSSTNLLKISTRKLPKVMGNKYIHKISTSLNLFHTRWKSIIGALAVSFVLSIAFFLTYYIALKTVDAPVGMSEVFTAMPIVDVVSSLPISISGLGVRERSFEFLFGDLTGIAPSVAVAASLLGFVFTVFWGVVGGILFIGQRKRLHKE